MNSLELAKEIVAECLQQDNSAQGFDENTAIMGAFPEFNSMTIVTIIATIEEQLDCEIQDEELSADIFETIGSLARFIESKM